MNTWLVWVLAYALSGNPIVAILAVALFLYGGQGWWSGRYWVPWAPFQRWMRIRELRAHVALNPFDATHRAELGRLLVDHRAAAEARGHLDAAIARVPNLAQPHWTLARACFALGEIDEGRKNVEIATSIRKDVGYGQPWADYGDALLARGRFVEAALAYERARDASGSGSELWYKLGVCRIALNDTKGAREALQTAIDVHDAAPGFRRRIDRAWRWRAWWKLRGLR